MRSVFISLLILLTSPVSAANAAPGLNDLSLLFPLPKDPVEKDRFHLRASSLLPGGRPLVTHELVRAFPVPGFHARHPMDVVQVYESLTVVSVRLDPCFKDMFSEHCRPQVRLVLQPLRYSQRFPGLVGDDSAIHLFYDLEKKPLLDFILRAASERSRHMSDADFIPHPLEVHPVLRKERMQGPYSEWIRHELMSLLSGSRLSRIAFFLVKMNGMEWVFQSFDIGSGGTTTPVLIPEFDVPSQLLERGIRGSLFEFGTTRFPLPAPKGDQLFDFLNDSIVFKQTGNVSELIERVKRIEDPRRHLPGTIDCTSCHASAPIRRNLTRAEIISDEDWLRSSYANRHLPLSVLRNQTLTSYDGINFRLFGYNLDQPIVGQRVVNETAEILSDLIESDIAR